MDALQHSGHRLFPAGREGREQGELHVRAPPGDDGRQTLRTAKAGSRGRNAGLQLSSTRVRKNAAMTAHAGIHGPTAPGRTRAIRTRFAFSIAADIAEATSALCNALASAISITGDDTVRASNSRPR